jgi:hypothetical protein
MTHPPHKLAFPLLLAGCAGFVPQSGPPPDPPGEFVGLTRPFIAVGDTQEHESTGFPMHDNDGAVDSYVEVAQRPPEQPLFGRRILEWAIQSHPDEPLIHLGDVLDMSCQSEISRMGHIFAAAKQPAAILPGNHDGLMFGIFNYRVLDTLFDPGAQRWDRACRRGASPDTLGDTGRGRGAALTKSEFIRQYVAMLATGPHPHGGLKAPAQQGDEQLSWHNPNLRAFVEAIEVGIVGGWRYAGSFIAQKLRLPAAPGASRRVTMIALDTNQVGALISTWDMLRGKSPGSSGHIRSDQVDAITKWVVEAQRAREIVVFAGHHNWNQLSLGSQLRLARLMSGLDHPLVYVSAHTHRGFWALHRTGFERPLLELNVSSLSDWPIAYRRISFGYDSRANRLQVRGELMPHPGTPARDDAGLLAAWEGIACTRAGLTLERLLAEDAAIVKQQRDSRGSIVEWLVEGFGERCAACQQLLYDHAQRYQDEMLNVIGELYANLGDDAHQLHTLKLPAFCGGADLPSCIAALQTERADGFPAHVALFRHKAQLVDLVSNHLDDLDVPQAKAYMTCRAVLAAKTDFDLTADDRNAYRSEANRQREQFFRIEASVGM